eukprot:jgi/Orpsp1_1/1182981/evm.model.c7180000083368.1
MSLKIHSLIIDLKLSDIPISVSLPLPLHPKPGIGMVLFLLYHLPLQVSGMNDILPPPLPHFLRMFSKNVFLSPPPGRLIYEMNNGNYKLHRNKIL